MGRQAGSGQLAARALVALLGGAGVMHFAAPEVFDPIVPRALPGRARTWTYLSGAAEVGCAGLVAAPRTRRVGGRLAALLFVAVFPANVKMAWDWRTQSMPQRTVACARVPLQIPLVLWALRVARQGDGR
ncbi:Uncharacterized membrane protein [Saccharopolyspora kobensis]|uniref:Uncharacterized membrane protein n=1 Tax=Saccharopolyspora kobensis TaxID=146035 RepID=A0A1H6EF51_9PSEU|nr:hypothetical protein [Saccharopolyspora kobensis]SEG96412.1 Uncharacterized membrane protein [Saccharopolyspora kobensis]SFD19515.1 Uncharacterized membrane protein [Saccharopolyspora kobensis]